MIVLLILLHFHTRLHIGSFVSCLTSVNIWIRTSSANIISPGFFSLCSLEIQSFRKQIGNMTKIVWMLGLLQYWRCLHFTVKIQIPRILNTVIQTIIVFPHLVSLSTILGTVFSQLSLSSLFSLLIKWAVSHAQVEAKRTWCQIFVLWSVWNGLLLMVLTERD